MWPGAQPSTMRKASPFYGYRYRVIGSGLARAARHASGNATFTNFMMVKFFAGTVGKNWLLLALTHTYCAGRTASGSTGALGLGARKRFNIFQSASGSPPTMVLCALRI